MIIQKLIEQGLKPDIIDQTNPDDIYMGYFLADTTNCLIKRVTKVSGVTSVKFPFGKFDFVFDWDQRANYTDWRYRDFPANNITLKWNHICNVPVFDASSVEDWNTFFDLPNYGNPFTSVVVNGNIVVLIGGSEIKLKMKLFSSDYSHGNFYLKEIIDNGCITQSDEKVFCDNEDVGCAVLTKLILPAVTDPVSLGYCPNLNHIDLRNSSSTGNTYNFFTRGSQTAINYIYSPENIGSYIDFRADLLTPIYINLSKCVNLGQTVGCDFAFINLVGQTITLVIPSNLMTCNAGSPDGDIQYLIDNNNVTIITV